MMQLHIVVAGATSLYGMYGYSIHIASICYLQVVPCLLSTTRKILGPSTILQAAIPDILEKVPQAYFDNTMKVVQVFSTLII